MKLSIWQQFASNHSNGFTVLGTFANEAQAASAVEKLRHILRDIYDRTSSYAEEASSPIEVDYGRQFGIA